MWYGNYIYVFQCNLFISLSFSWSPSVLSFSILVWSSQHSSPLFLCLSLSLTKISSALTFFLQFSLSLSLLHSARFAQLLPFFSDLIPIFSVFFFLFVTNIHSAYRDLLGDNQFSTFSVGFFTAWSKTDETHREKE